MNTKTTLFLAFSLVVLGALYYVLQSRPQPTEADTTPMISPTAAAARDLIEDKLGDVVKVVCKRKGALGNPSRPFSLEEVLKD